MSAGRVRLPLFVVLALAVRVATADDARDADRALAEGRPTDAIAHLEAMRAAHPDDPIVPYNLGIASWRAGDAEAARRWFGRVLEETADPALRARAAYNLGAMALRGDRPGRDEVDLQKGLEVLDDAIGHFRAALDADPTDADARANGELAWRMRDVLQQQQQQQDQQQDQQQNQQQDQPQQDQPQQEQPQQEQPQQDQPQQDQPQQDQPQQDQPQDQPQQADDAQDEPASPPPTSERETRLTREEAERLLQRVRDRDRQRREAELARGSAKSPPVEKDW